MNKLLTNCSRTCVLAVSLCVMAGCGGANGVPDDSSTTDPGDPKLGDTVVSDCPSAAAVASVSDILPYVPADWPAFCSIPNAAVHAGQAFELSTPIELLATDLVPSGVDSAVVFDLELYGAYANRVEIVASTDINGLNYPTKIKLQPGEYRFRGEVRLPLSGEQTRYAQLVVIPGCHEPCPDGWARCSADMACYKTDGEFYADSYSLYCLGMSPEASACNRATGNLDDGTPCAIETDCQDTYTQGSCVSGICTP